MIANGQFETETTRRLEDSAYLLNRRIARREARIETLILSGDNQRYCMLENILRKSDMRFHPMRITEIEEVFNWHQTFARAAFYIFDLTGLDKVSAEHAITVFSEKMEKRIIILDEAEHSKTFRQKFGSIVEWFGNGVGFDLDLSPIPSVIQCAIR